MKKVLVATDKPFAAEAVAGIKRICTEAGYEFILLENYQKPALLEAIKDVNAVIIRSDIIDKEVLDASNNLNIVVRAGAGYDNVDLNASTAKNVVVMNTPGQNANAVAELAFGMMLYSIRKGFKGSAGTELRGKTLGIHAFGNVGRLIAQIGQGFGMDVYAYDPFVDSQIIKNAGFKPVDSESELYSTCQFISLNIPLTAGTKASISTDLLSKMPAGATLVNTARKEVIDEAALLKIYAERKDFVYLSDIAPDCKDQIIEKYPERAFFTPKKMGAQTAEANINAGLAAMRQIVDFFEKGDITFKVN